MTFLQSFTYMKISLDIFTRQQMTVYTRASKLMVLIGEVPQKCQVLWQKYSFIIVTKEIQNVF